MAAKKSSSICLWFTAINSANCKASFSRAVKPGEAPTWPNASTIASVMPSCTACAVRVRFHVEQSLSWAILRRTNSLSLTSSRLSVRMGM